MTPRTVARQDSLSFTISRRLPKLTSIESVILSNCLIVCHPLLLLPSIFPGIRVFSNESVLLIRRPKFWSFSFYISPPGEYSGLIPFRIDWFDLLGSSGDSDGKKYACNVGDWGSIPGSERPPWRREWLPFPVFLPGEFHGQMSLKGYSPWSHKQLDMTEWLTLSL